MTVLYPHDMATYGYVDMIISWMRTHVAQSRVLAQEGSGVDRGNDLALIGPVQYRHKGF